MKKGWRLLCQSQHMDRHSAIQLLESTMKVQKVVLDKQNITIILTAWELLRKYSLLHDYKKGLAHFESLGEDGITAFFHYGAANEIDSVCTIVARCCRELGMNKETNKLEEVAFKFFPKVPSYDSFRMYLGKKYLLQ